MNKKHIFTLKTTIYLLGVMSILLPLAYACSPSKKTMTRSLFMQSKRANIEHPHREESEGGSAVLSEQVAYRNADNYSDTLRNRDKKETQKTSLNEMQHLDEVVVTASRLRATPEREGRVNVDFVIRVPKELLSANQRLKLTPKLLDNDSIIKLDDVILRGPVFSDKQKNDYAVYDQYEKSIIDKSDYDRMFLNKKQIDKDIRSRQDFYWDMYYKQWNLYMSYRKWVDMMEDRYAFFNAKQEGNLNFLEHEYSLKALEQSIRNQALEKDTTGISACYAKKFTKQSKLLPKYRLRREITLKNMPSKYCPLFKSQSTLDNITNHTMTPKDSIDISSHRYFYDAIASNEMKGARKDEMFDKIVPFTYADNFRIDSLIVSDNDFVYYYKQEYPVRSGMKSLRVTMSGRIQAVDHSSFDLPKADTLSYTISSLVQLADTTLIIKGTKIYRNMYHKITIYPKFASEEWAFNINYEDNRQQIETLMKDYNMLTQERGLRMDSLEMKASSSLDGSYDFNMRLSENRVEALKEYLLREYSQIEGENIIKTSYIGEDWKTLVSFIKQRTEISNKQEIFDMLSNAVYPDQTEKEIKQKYRSDYKIIQDSIYPLLRKIDVTFNVSRPGMIVTDSIQTEIKDGYAEGLRLLQNRDYWEALEILNQYPDYNTALCLTCMGYNGKAYDMLVQLTPNANTEYLMAIVCSRMDKEDEAVKHLVKACEMDTAKVYRTMIDPEVSKLVNKYNLHEKLNN